MATEEATALPGTPSYGKWGSWLAALIGLWILVSPFVLTGEITASPVMWSNLIAGLLILVLGAYGAYWIRSAVATEMNSLPEFAGWIAALVGIWIAISPFALAGGIGTGAAMWSNAVAGLVTLVFAAYAGYDIHTTE